MHPIICQIGPYAVYGHGTLFALAIIISSFLFFNDARRRGFDQFKLLKLIFWSTFGGILGAKFFHSGTLNIFTEKGFSFHGALILGSLFAWYFMGKYGLPRAIIFDLTAPNLAIFQAIARIGCFLEGCCYGKPVSWGMYFPVHHAVLHPTQLYLMDGSLVIYCILKRYQKTASIAGEVFLLYLILELCMRIIVDFFRVYHFPVWMGLNTYQWGCLDVLIGVGYFYASLKSRRRG